MCQDGFGEINAEYVGQQTPPVKLFPDYSKPQTIAISNNVGFQVPYDCYLACHVHDLRTYARLWVSYDNSNWIEIPGLHWGDYSYTASFALYLEAKMWVKTQGHCMGEGWQVRIFPLK